MEVTGTYKTGKYFRNETSRWSRVTKLSFNNQITVEFGDQDEYSAFYMVFTEEMNHAKKLAVTWVEKGLM